MSPLEIILVSMQAYVDRCAAEMRDPATRPERVAEIVGRLGPLYDRLRLVNAAYRDRLDGDETYPTFHDLARLLEYEGPLP